jgi:LuxR family transcriptional regulator, quorum-sensing system regulator BjaR1
MEDLVERALAFTDRANAHEKVGELLSDFSELVHGFGFNHFIMTGLPSYGEDVEKLIVAMGWPVQWLDRYREGNYFFNDPVSMEAMQSARKYSWLEARARHPVTKISQQIESEASDMGLIDGLAFPLFDPDNWQAIVSLSSDQRLDLPDRMQNMVYLAAAVAQGRATALIEPERPRVARLTARERDVLSWMAHGKTKGEVAEILTVSENTVRMHVRHIIDKLNVSNVTHAVAKAIHSRQIQL